MKDFEATRVRLLAIFFEEVVEHVGALERGALALEIGEATQEQIAEMFRAAHSIKGSGAALGLKDLAAFVHVLEDLLAQLRDGRLQASKRVGAAVLGAVDGIGQLVSAAQHGTPNPSVEGQRHELEAIRGGEAKDAVSAPAAHAPEARGPFRARLTFRPESDAFRRGLDPVLLLRGLARICERYHCTCDRSALDAADPFDPERSYLSFVIEIECSEGRAAVEEIFEFVGGEQPLVIEERLGATPVPGAPAPASAGAGEPPSTPAPRGAEADQSAGVSRLPIASSSVRVDIGKIDRLMDVMGEIVIAQAMVQDLVGSLAGANLPSLQAALQHLERNTRELQERVMGIRMLPVSTLYQRFPRIVRELGERLGKDVRLTTAGGETELDKTLIDLLGDPLTHLVRNAVDHGVETREDRARAGKPPVGTVTIRAYHDAGSVVISVGDDGRGIDHAAVIKKARAIGLVGPDEEVSESRVLSLLFEPGFSTAREVTDVSGRGVGMDVVRRNVESLNGALTVENRPGQGASFIVRVPLTLAIVEGLLVEVGTQVFVLPLLAVLKSFSMRREQLRALHDGSEIVDLVPRPLQLVRLGRILGVDSSVPAEGGLAIVLQDGGRRFCLLVDGIRGRLQVVMKNLETNFKRIEGVLGATILGNGRVALVLDVSGLARLGRVEMESGSRIGEARVVRAA